MSRRKPQTMAAIRPGRPSSAGRAPRRAALPAALKVPAKSSTLKAFADGPRGKARAKPDIKAGRGTLQQQLDASEAHVRELEARLAEVTDRIAWIADRLHSLLEDSG